MKTYLTGIVILIGAIIVNYLATALQLPNWYAFLQKTSITGFIEQAFRLPFISAIWLLIGYPLILGFLAKMATHLVDKK